MSASMYPKLALSGMKKNRRLYIPYILTCVGMVMMYYIVRALSESPAVAAIRGGSEMQALLGLGYSVIAFFAVIFLFYTNSFLIKRRRREFGLYNVLGMDKRNIAAILIIETLIIALIAIVGGLAAGILLSKLAELLMLKLVNGEVNFSFYISVKGIRNAAMIFGAIFLLLLANSLRQIKVANPVEMLRTESIGEKPPKENWLLGILGVVILGGAYYLALTIRDPLDAMVWFFVAVLMVIAATYLLFIAGSVLLCRILQKNKKTYYKTERFVSVSSLAFRMKRNGAGLASICILSTMVLVIVSSTSCLYLGVEDCVREQYPWEISMDIVTESGRLPEEESCRRLAAGVERIAEENGIVIDEMSTYGCAEITAYFNGAQMQPDPEEHDAGLNYFDGVYTVCFYSLEEYRRFADPGTEISENEILLSVSRGDYANDCLILPGGRKLTVKGPADGIAENLQQMKNVVPTLFVVVSDFDVIAELAESESSTGGSMLTSTWYCGFETDADTDRKLAATGEFWTLMQEEMERLGEGDYSCYTSCREIDRESLITDFGGLFYLGIILSTVFLLATVLIIYYKQICEGYEDQSRFEIMQKLGMTKREIRRSINSQMLTVFFAPLLFAVLHLAFAFPMITKLLLLMNFTNTRLFIITAAVSAAVFALFYVIIYSATTRTYYSIAVSAEK